MSGKETKQRILEVSNELFATCGYDDVTMRDIGKKVGITEGAIYRHYESKAQILEDIITSLGQKVGWIIHSLEKEQLDKYLKTETPRQVLERCKITFPKTDFLFMAYAFSIVLQEHLTNPAAKELVIHQLYYKIAERIQYVLDRLQEQDSIPKFSTKAFSLVWARFSVSSLALWVSLCNSGISPDKAEVDYQSTLDWLTDLALSGRAK